MQNPASLQPMDTCKTLLKNFPSPAKTGLKALPAKPAKRLNSPLQNKP
jgi:hypothetical protein